MDTGADISLVKVDSLKDDTIVNRQPKIVLAGITNESLTTLGICEGKITLSPSDVLEHQFSVVSKHFQLNQNADGILGRDFLIKFGAIINYQTHNIKLMYRNKPFFIPFLIEMKSSVPIIIPARTNKLVKVYVTNKHELLCHSEELAQGVFVGNALIKPKNGMVSIPIMNTNQNDFVLNNFYPKLEVFSNTTINHRSTTLNLCRLDSLKTKVNQSNDWNTEESESITNIIEEYQDIFHLPNENLSYSKIVKHTIPTLSDTAPINIRPYRLPQIQKEEIDKQMEKLLEDKIISPSKSPWNFPLLVVPKKGTTKFRVVVDYRKLNNITIGDAFPLPNINEIFDQLGFCQYFSTLDLANGYHQLQVHEDDRHKTAFSTPKGHYEFNRMPFGLKGAPATFQRMMTYVLSGLQGIHCLVYLDDIIVYGKNLADHNLKLTQVFQQLRKNNLKLQPEKCYFLQREINYLGHIIAKDGVKPDPEKIKCVENFPRPENVKEIQSFLGLANYYRRFIQNFSKIAEPLNKLLRKKEQFLWKTETENAFIELKSILTGPKILQFPDFNKEFLLTTDASITSIGAILSQGEIGHDLPISYASRVLNKAERNYSTIERELLAIVWAVQNFRPYLYGRPFTIISDHKPLVWVFNIKDPSSRLMRWRLKLEEYDYKVIYKPGAYNTNADALSRIPIRDCLAITRSKTKTNPISNINSIPNTSSTSKLNQSLNSIPNSIIQDTENSTPQEVSDEDTIKTIIKEFHDSPIGGHQGISRTYKRIKTRYTWKNMIRDITTYIKKCPKCQKNKYGINTKVPMAITTTSFTPFDKIFLDIVGPLPVTDNNNKFILTMQDDLSKYSDAFAMPNAEADTVAKVFVTQIICRHGTPQNILTDQGTNFLSKLFKGVCKLLQINKLQTTAYRPQTNGALERSHRTLGEYLRSYTDQDLNNWDQWLPYAMFTYNSTPHTTTNLTPFKILYGCDPKLPSSIKNKPNPVYNYDDYVQELRARLQSTYAIARDNILKHKQNSKLSYDKNTAPVNFHIGDSVLLKVNSTRKKLEPLYHGPYEIIELNSNENSTIRINNKLKKVHNNHLKKFHSD